MLDEEEGDERQEEEETEEAMTMEYAEETIREWGQDDDIEEPMTTQQGGVQDNPLRTQSPETIGTTTVAPEAPRRPNLQGDTEQPSPSARDIVPEEYYDYLHVFEGKDNLG
jgi:hypothetical protein